MEAPQERYRTPILQEAAERIHGERTKTYGPAVESFGMVASITSLLTGKEITPMDCLLMQTAQKLVRHRFSPDNQDHLRDAVGYLGMLEEVEHDLRAAKVPTPVYNSKQRFYEIIAEAVEVTPREVETFLLGSKLSAYHIHEMAPVELTNLYTRLANWTGVPKDLIKHRVYDLTFCCQPKKGVTA